MIALGLNSGTSADGVSAALVRFRGRRLELLAERTLKYPRALRERVLAARDATTPELSALNADLGRFFAKAAVLALRGRRADVVGSHGQTVWHEPGRHTLQIGEAAFVAEATRTTTVCDFRAADVAAGGQGAPLMPILDRALFAGRPCATLNLGGIANVCFPGGPRSEASGFDAGPANCLIDEAMRVAYGKDLDRGGRVAASGRVDPALAARFGHPWLAKPPPKSTGRELWSRDFLLERAGRELRRRPADVVASLTWFTARTVGAAIARWGPAVQEVIVSGGGVYNRTLMKHLEWAVWPAAVRPIDVFGIPPLAKEPVLFAFLAALAVRGRAAGLPSVTGARRPAVLGKILPAGPRR
jgi:anhydro-N-acetylmuramic acid kinase